MIVGVGAGCPTFASEMWVRRIHAITPNYHFLLGLPPLYFHP